MQLTKTFFPNSAIFIEKKWVENRLSGKSAFLWGKKNVSCCPTGTYFTTYQAAAVHYVCSTACHQSLRGIATAVLPNRPADTEAGGSGAAGGLGWAVQTRRRHNGASASEHDTCQHTYSLRCTDIYPMSRILYDFVFTVY